jgi:hypothetical protein
MNPEELLGQNDGQQRPPESPLISLKKDLEFYKETLREVAVEIMVEGLSAYPIFVAHQHQVALGEIIINHTELGTNWTIQASTLEEFQEKGIIQSNKKDSFLQSYKPADDFMCVFVVVPEGANFVYFPYQ